MNEHFNVSEKRILPTFLLFLVLSWPLAHIDFFLSVMLQQFYLLLHRGFGIWCIIDFILIVTGSMKDDRGQVVKIWVD